MRTDGFTAVFSTTRGTTGGDDLAEPRPNASARQRARSLVAAFKRGEREETLAVLHQHIKVLRTPGDLADRPLLAELATAVTEEAAARCQQSASEIERWHGTAFENESLVDTEGASGDAADRAAREQVWGSEWDGEVPPETALDVESVGLKAARQQIAYCLAGKPRAAEELTDKRCRGTLSASLWEEILTGLYPAPATSDSHVRPPTARPPESVKQRLYQRIERELPF